MFSFASKFYLILCLFSALPLFNALSNFGKDPQCLSRDACVSRNSLNNGKHDTLLCDECVGTLGACCLSVVCWSISQGACKNDRFNTPRLFVNDPDLNQKFGCSNGLCYDVVQKS